MKNSLEVTYYHHSGFSCATKDVLLVFDYWLGEHAWLPEEKRLTIDELRKYKEVVVFISHSHPDHMDPVVYEWSQQVPVTYVIGPDLPPETLGVRVHKGDSLRLSEHVSVKVFDSTDLGVSFLVTLDGIHIFHAGDLNFWHWREESTVQEIEEAEQDFQKACAPLQGEEIDLAFFPVDPRQGRLFDAGANYFIMTVKPRLLLPMHFWGRAEIAIEFARRARCRETEVVALTSIGAKMRLDVEEDGFMTVNLLTAPEVAPKMNTVDLDGYVTDDPFRSTDMPVDLAIDDEELFEPEDE